MPEKDRNESQPTEITPPTERRIYRAADPGTLVGKNPAAYIINREVYDQIAAHFVPDRFDPPQVTRVATSSILDSNASDLCIVDGHHRTLYVHKNKEKIAGVYPDFKFTVNDITDHLLANPKVVPIEERVEGQMNLTPVQYLRSIVLPTLEHIQTAPDRFAAQLINTWEKMVGEELAQKYSAIAALNLLSDLRGNSLQVRAYVSAQSQIVSGETREQRRVLERALVDMASIINHPRLIRRQVAESAFMLVASGSLIIGGEREALRQIHGLLHTPSVDKKLTGSDGEKEQKRVMLAKVVKEAFGRQANNPNKEFIINRVLSQALADPNLSYEQVEAVLQSPSPSETFNGIRQEVNVGRLTSAYCLSTRRKDLSDEELRVITNLGRRAILEDRDLPSLVRAAASTQELLQRTLRLRDDIDSRKEQLVSAGVTEQTVKGLLASFDEAVGYVFSATTTQALSLGNKKLGDVEKTIKWTITRTNINQAIDSIFDTELQEKGSVIRRNRILTYINSLFPHVDSSNEVRMRRIVIQLSKLDRDLQERVMAVELDFRRAEQLQDERNLKNKQSTIGLPTQKTPLQNESRGEVELEVRPPEANHSISPESRQASLRSEDRPQFRRIEDNNQRLRGVVGAFAEELKTINLDSYEVDPETKRAVQRLLYNLFKLAIDSEDIAEVIESIYPNLRGSIRRPKK